MVAEGTARATPELDRCSPNTIYRYIFRSRLTNHAKLFSRSVGNFFFLRFLYIAAKMLDKTGLNNHHIYCNVEEKRHRNFQFAT